MRLDEIEDLAYRALVASKTSAENARTVAASIAAAEADGIPSHGLLRVPAYCDHARSGKVDGFARPSFTQSGPSAIQVDARDGFAHPAIDVALRALVPLARTQGVAAAGIRNSYNSGVMGHHVARVAREGLVALGFANAPAGIAPWGGSKALFGTNPIAFAAPREGGDPIVIDQAASVVARGEILLRAKRGEMIPEGWALDASGQPTTDPNALLAGGSMAPAGGYKGVSLALIVEVLAATLTGALHSYAAGSLIENDGKSAGVGQFFIVVDPARFGGGAFGGRVRELCEEIDRQEGARVPGSRRAQLARTAQDDGVQVDDRIAAQVAGLAAS